MLEKLNKYLFLYYFIMAIINYGAFYYIDWININLQALILSSMFWPAIDIIIILKFLGAASVYIWGFIL